MEQDTKVLPNDKNYRYNLYINIKAINDFLIDQGTQDVELKSIHIHILSFFVAMTGAKGIKTLINNNGDEYFLAQNPLIINNLKFLGVKSRQLKNIVKKLEVANTIDRETVNRNQRYVRVNHKLLQMWHTENWTITPTRYMFNHMPHLWESFKNEWEPFLGSDRFKDAIDWCNNEIDSQGIKYNDYDAVYKLMQNTLGKWNNGSNRKTRN